VTHSQLVVKDRVKALAVFVTMTTAVWRYGVLDHVSSFRSCDFCIETGVYGINFITAQTIDIRYVYMYSVSVIIICPNFIENRRCMHNSTFVINRNIKTMGILQKSSNKIMQVFNYFDSQ